MIKRLLYFFILTLSGTLFAQHYGMPGGYSRILAMGESPYIEDYDNIKFNAAYIAEFSDFAYGDLGNSLNQGQFAGFNLEVMEHFHLGAVISNKSFQHVDYVASISMIDNTPAQEIAHVTHDATYSPVELNNTLAFMAAYNWHHTILGLGISYNASSNTYTAPDTVAYSRESSASQIGINLGAIVPITDYLKVDISTSIILPSASYSVTSDTATDEYTFSKSIIAVDSRIYYKMGHFELVPLLAFEMIGEKLEEPDHGQEKENLPSEMKFSAGIGFNYYTQRLTFTCGVKMTQESIVYDATETSPEETLDNFAFPIVNMGVEYRLTKWLTARYGYIAESNSYTTVTALNETDTQERSYTLYHKEGGSTLGLGFKFDRFNIDAAMDADIIRKGLGNLSGDHDTFSYISVGCKL